MCIGSKTSEIYSLECTSLRMVTRVGKICRRHTFKIQDNLYAVVGFVTIS
jgi:hypothetical protein